MPALAVNAPGYVVQGLNYVGAAAKRFLVERYVIQRIEAARLQSHLRTHTPTGGCMRLLARMAAAALVAVSAGCGGDGDGITEVASVAGTYTLQSVNGAPLPFTFVDEGGYKLEVTGASYTLSNAGTFTNTASYRETEGGVVSTSAETYTGSYSVSAGTITFTDSDGDTLTGSISGNTLQFSEEGLTAVFVK